MYKLLEYNIIIFHAIFLCLSRCNYQKHEFKTRAFSLKQISNIIQTETFVLRSICVYSYVHMYLITINLKLCKESYMGGFRGRKIKKKIMYLYYKQK